MGAAVVNALQERLAPAEGAEPLLNSFDPDQPRDESGRWTDYGGGTSQASSKAFESLTSPLRKRVLFGDQVAFMSGDKVDVGVLSGPDNGEGFEILLSSGEKVRRKRDLLRTPKGGYKGRDT
jgi:hypothetical protein